jgi:NIMA (never in mitosis gene a)-related kinase
MDWSRFEKIRVLGEGTFGRCYLVNNKQTNELCVLKQISITDMSDKDKEDAMKEARILEALDHPSIIKLIGSFKSKGGYLNIVMNYADGGDMAKALRDAKGVYFSENQILNWFTQICLALKHVHDRKVIHRDLKCENIFLTKEKLVKLGDFGIAKSLKQTI